MEITKNDIGRKVRLRNGDVAEIVAFNSGATYPVYINTATRQSLLTVSGWHNVIGTSEFDAIEFVDAPTAPVTPSTATDLEELQQHIAKALSLLEAYPEAIRLEVTSGLLTVSLQKRTE